MTIKVRFPNFNGDTSREMTIQEIRDNHSGCLLVGNGEQVDILDSDKYEETMLIMDEK